MPRTRRRCLEAAAAAAAGLLLGPAAARSAMPLSCRIEAPEAFAPGQPVELVFVLRNDGPSALQLLVWNTPLEPPGFGRWAELSRDGQALPFRGAMIKRGDPAAADYRPLGAGEALRHRFVLAPAWDTRPPGRYRLVPALRLHDVAAAGTPLPRPRDAFDAQPLACAAVEFRVLG